MLSWIDKYGGGCMVQSLKLILFDAERRTFAVQGQFPLNSNGELLEDGDKYDEFFNKWTPKVMQAYYNTKEKTITGKVNPF